MTGWTYLRDWDNEATVKVVYAVTGSFEGGWPKYMELTSSGTSVAESVLLVGASNPPFDVLGDLDD